MDHKSSAVKKTKTPPLPGISLLQPSEMPFFYQIIDGKIVNVHMDHKQLRYGQKS